MMAVSLWHLFFFGDMKTALSRAALMLFGVLYAGFLPTLLLHLRRLDDGQGWFLMLLAIVWLADTGAYFSGRALGKHKMYPAVSPGKSWEGAVGGLLSSVGGAFLCRALFLKGLTVPQVLLISVPAGILGQLGDLVESLIKRAYGVKDSGRSIPGHGGVLDRFDAIFFAAPYIYFIARVLH
jgi:phosphatidate cytidylyltransferase